MTARYVPNPNALALLEGANWQGLRAMSQLYARDVKTNLGVSGRPRRTASGRFVSQEPSRPGEYPRRASGTLLRSIAVVERENDMAIDVGARTNAFYAIFLERGTRRMGERSFLIRSLIIGRNGYFRQYVETARRGI